MAWGLLFSIIQPLNRPPDEGAHAQYIRFLAEQRRLPRWEPWGGGEAGYEAQHPPLYYALGAAVYGATKGLPEPWRWHALRWFTLLLGSLLFWVARGFFLDYFRGQWLPAWIATAGFMLTPLTLLYLCYINVDGMSLLWCSVILWLSVRRARGMAASWEQGLLPLALGLGLLTKLTVLGTLPTVVLAHLGEPGVGKGEKRLRLLLTLAGALAVAGWWYARNSWLYGTPFIHTVAYVGSGLSLAERTGQGAWLLWFTLRETYLSTWAQRGWLPPGGVEGSLYGLLTALLLLAAGKGLRARGKAPDPAAWLCGILMLSLILGHQFQVWWVDYEFNAGGRYLLNGLMGLHALVVDGLGSLRRPGVGWALWALLFLVMDAFSAHRIWTVLNPRYAPGWRLFQFPP